MPEDREVATLQVVIETVKRDRTVSRSEALENVSLAFIPNLVAEFGITPCLDIDPLSL
jgi:hypothetical protein